MHLHLIDGSAYIHRAFHALPPLTRKRDGLPTNAIMGFVSMMLDLREGRVGATHMAVVLDGGRSGRDRLHPGYKAHRPPRPPELTAQLPYIDFACEALSIATVKVDGMEADDLIAAYATLAADDGGFVTIHSSDKDLAQLVSGAIEIRDPMSGKTMSRDSVREKFGVWPEQMVDFQALLGDAVDGIPGVPGIGAKTAAALLAEHGTLDAILARAHNPRIPMPCTTKRRQALIDGRHDALLSRELARLRVDSAVPAPLDHLAIHAVDADRLLAFLDDMEFASIARDRRGMMV